MHHALIRRHYAVEPPKQFAVFLSFFCTAVYRGPSPKQQIAKKILMKIGQKEAYPQFFFYFVSEVASISLAKI